jgi:hypothetical protein
MFTTVIAAYASLAAFIAAQLRLVVDDRKCERDVVIIDLTGDDVEHSFDYAALLRLVVDFFLKLLRLAYYRTNRSKNGRLVDPQRERDVVIIEEKELLVKKRSGMSEKTKAFILKEQLSERETNTPRSFTPRSL